MQLRPVWAEVDLGAIRHNASVLARLVKPAALCAVVKADGYGHGAVPVAKAAIEGGATWLGVALVEEAEELRAAGVDAPVLLLSEPPLDGMAAVVALGLRPTIYTAAALEAAAAAARADAPLPIHVKVDTGMHRVGAGAGDAVKLARAAAERPELLLEGFWTHLAVADEPGNQFTAEQLTRFRAVVDELAAAGVHPPVLHACNSAGALTWPPARHHLVRCGIALYGLAPSLELEGCADLRPAMSLEAKVSLVKRVGAGEGVSYGLRYAPSRETTIATVPIGYADGLTRRLGHIGGEVLIGGRRRPIAGTVTMDQILVDCGDDDVATGDEVALLGRQGDEEITAWDWARRLDTIAYEVVCGIGPRVPRVYT